MAVNKVVYGGNTIIDLSGSTVTPETLLEGEKAYNAAGELITGTAKAGGGNLQTKSVMYNANGTATITPDEGYDGLSSADITVAIPVYDGSVT